MTSEKIHGWNVTDGDDGGGPTLMLEKKGRSPLVMAYNEGMEREVLLEYAATRILEAELRDAGDTASQTLRDTYDQHVEDSRDNQLGRETKRRRAEERGERG